MNSNPSEQAQTILVVDDNEANRELAKSTLEDEGYVVVVAHAGEAAVATFASARPDCILLDVRMPDIDGFVVCERIRATPEGRDTPVIFLTALRDVDTFDRALRAGGDDFLTKPVRPTELIVRVQSALKLTRMRTELHEHYELLKRQRDDLMRLQLQKERLSTFLVHDLKNPVNAMDLHAQLLLRDATLSPRSQESATQIRAAARQLNRMILNLLDISKADEGKLTPKSALINLVALVDEVLLELAANAQARKVGLEKEIGVEQIFADEHLLHRALANLVENAVRHAPAESVVKVKAIANDGAVELRVIDAGRGVPAEMREKVFDPFIQVEGSDLPDSRAGRGLGLTFCRLAIQAHCGQIWVEDGSPGAVFCMRLPNES